MHLLWRGLNPCSTRLEHLALDPWTRARGTVIDVGGSSGFAVQYDVAMDESGFPTCVRVCLSDGSQLKLSRTSAGEWLQGSQPLPGLSGCTDIDITATPFTNTLPLRRLGLQIGEHAAIEVVWLGLPGLTLQRVRQRYTRLSEQQYRYENLQTGYCNEVTVDGDGLVQFYPGAFERIEPA